MKRFALALALVLAALVGTTPTAADAGQLVDVAVVNRTTGQRVPVYPHAGRLYVAGNPGDRYAVHVGNRTGQRVMTVVSVDGINVVTGETASQDQNGYVLGPWQSFEIAGWRKNLNEVAAFYFTRLPDSYAARTDRPNNVGVIGVAVYREWQPPRPAPLQPRPFSGRKDESAAARDEARASGMAENTQAPAGSAPAEADAAPAKRQRALQDERIGTGHGERQQSTVVYTEFRRASPYPAETLTIYYDTPANLIARGIIPAAAPVVTTPNPFPDGRFVPDPRG
jgi:hypothetical protein